MTSRDQILGSIRAALAPSVPEPPAVRLQPESTGERVARFKQALEALGGKVATAGSPQEARSYINSVASGRRIVASRAAILEACGISSSGFSRESCAAAEIGISSADYALADTGTLVMLTESGESRLISLLPPCHIAVIEQAKILSSLDELFTLTPQPAARSSAMALITGPSRTADIEMRLVRGVHGPGEIHVLVVAEPTAT